MNFRSKITFAASLIAGLGLALASTARAADPTPAPAAGTQSQPTAAPAASTKQKSVSLGAVQVSGIRASLAVSLDTKRNADAVVDAVTATDIGKFPTTSVADALALIPGVTLDHVMPATERVSIDGLDPSLNVSLLDGHPVAQALWLFGDSPNRGFNFSLLPSELVGKVEVYKSPEARLTEGSLGGLIIMHTVEPLDVDANTVRGSIGYNYNDMISEGKPNASGFYSYKNDDSSFGIDFSAQHYEQVISRQGMENYGYSSVSALASGAAAAAASPTNPLPNNGYVQKQLSSGALNGNDLVPNQLSAANFFQVERRNTVFSNIEFKPNANFESTVSLMYGVDDLDNTNQSTYAWDSLRPGGISSLGGVVNGIVTTGTSSAGTGANGPCVGDTAGACAKTAITLSDNFARASEITTEGVDWRTKYTAYDWSMTTQVGISDSTNPIQQVLKEIAYGGSFNWNLNNGFQFTDPSTANKPKYWADFGWGGNDTLLNYAARDTYGQIDFTKDLEGVFNDVQFGVRMADHWESQSEDSYSGFAAKTLDQIGYGGLSDLNGASSLGLSPSMVSHVQTSGFGAIFNANPLSATANYPNSPDGNTYYTNTWNVQQDNTAAYVQGDFSSGKMHGNVGVRVVSSKVTSQGFNDPGNCYAADTLNCKFPSGYGWLTYDSTHVNVLPSFNIADEVVQDVVLRGAFSQTVAYAPYNQLAPYFEANDTVLTAAAGNPNLKPYESWNLDGSIEWYFAPESALAGSLFYKDVTNYIIQQETTQQRINGSWTLPGFSKPTIGCTAQGLCQYAVTTPEDGGSAKVKGFAVSYQQAFAETGFGLRANYTYSDGTTESGGDLPYNSKNTYSIAPYYEMGPVSASISYSYRSSYLAGGYVAGAPATYTDSYKEMDASVTYDLTQNLALNLSGLNLLNSTYYQYSIPSDPHIGNLFADEYKTGRQYLLTLNMKF